MTFESGQRVVLVTGYPGLRARAVVRETLAAEPETSVVLLVHPARRSRALPLAAETGAGQRLSLLFSDPTAIDFGLDARSYRDLLERVTVVQHLYQVLDRGAPAEAAHAANVGGARELVEFVRAATRLERVVAHSSLFVSGDRTGLVLESELGRGQRFRSPVEESLAIAERMLAEARLGCVAVARAAEVVGDSRTGEVDRLHGVYAPLVFLAGSPRGTRLPLPPRSEVALQLIPVDFLAQAAVALARHPDAAGKTVHLIDRRALSARRLLELGSKRFGHELEPGLNAAFGRALFNNPGVSLIVKNLRTLGDLLAPGAVYDDQNARALLETSGVGCPPLESYLGVLFDALEEKLKEGKPAGSPVEAADAVD